ncbi:hypothetical protein JTE90_018522 [Oedothorax gibbosus]|uniref:Secreted protein n=1 Tax=Oedothorax gibbosus TaxID=931172 RepID=A0AAV6UPZ4_9ARAC|nr:hypothetical protein JTE90_018522 [Oedothorax gibbosus]
MGVGLGRGHLRRFPWLCAIGPLTVVGQWSVSRVLLTFHNRFIHGKPSLCRLGNVARRYRSTDRETHLLKVDY